MARASPLIVRPVKVQVSITKYEIDPAMSVSMSVCLSKGSGLPPESHKHLKQLIQSDTSSFLPFHPDFAVRMAFNS